MRATAIGLGAILLWAALAVLTIEARGIPPFELLALTFAVAFLIVLIVLIVQLVRGRAAVAELRQGVAPWLCAFCDETRESRPARRAVLSRTDRVGHAARARRARECDSGLVSATVLIVGGALLATGILSRRA